MSGVMPSGAWRWMVAASLAVVLSFAALAAARSGDGLALGAQGATGTSSGPASPLAELAADQPARRVEVIVQLRPGTDPATGRALVNVAGGTISRELPIINGFGTTLPAEEAQRLSLNPAVHAVALNAPVSRDDDDDAFRGLATSYNQSVRTPDVWQDGHNGRGVGVAVIDTGIDGSLPDFRVSETNPASRVIASAVVNPAAENAGDSFGHGTHIAGLIAGNGFVRPQDDPLRGRYVGTAPRANLISVKASDEEGNATVLDVIDGLQFVIDHKNDYNIRVVNLSLASTQAESYRTDPLDAAVEAAWNSGIVVVAAAGNSGRDADAVSYAPGNDPFIITVGGVDDMGTKSTSDDHLASWSSRGLTQDGFAKPDILAPGAHMASTVPAGAAYRELCPDCVVDGDYFNVGGTSMAAAVVSGVVADMIDADPRLTPNDVKTVLVKRTRPVTKSEDSGVLVDSQGQRVEEERRGSTVYGAEAAADKAVDEDGWRRTVNDGLAPNILLEPATGLIDFTRASWKRASWKAAPEELSAGWSYASWARASWKSVGEWSATPETCADFERASWKRASWKAEELAVAESDCSALLAEIDPSRASWKAAEWSRASWKTSFTK